MPKIESATLLLCDSAQVVSGKLYILGGGWGRLLASKTPTMLSLAVHILGDFEENKLHEFTLDLYKGSERYQVDGRDVVLVGHVVATRVEDDAKWKPPGDVNVAVSLAIPFEPGTYAWKLSVDGQFVTQRVFDVVPALSPSSERAIS